MSSQVSSQKTAQSDVGIEKAEEFARDHPGLVKLGRVGWVAKGLVYGLMGILAIIVATDSAGGGSGDEASQSGAISNIARRWGGDLLLYLVAAGLVLYTIWRIVTILLPAENDFHAWLKRGGYAVSAITYIALAASAFSLASNPGNSGSNGESEDARIEKLTRDTMERGGGRIAIAIVGTALLVIAGYFLWKGVTAGFRSQILPGGVGPISGEQLITLGRIGWAGRSAMMGLIGFFLVRAAINFDPDDAKGLDGSLRSVADTTIGSILVVGVGIGLLLYGIFCVLSAPRQRLAPADE